ncbi:Asp-tRNA(Asn)/Glu-tRNA(Gln) amidotransferase subunit GatA [Archaeoglobus fulgidus]|uniref:Glutamyl-tRNA(Gln) amidotransferase subunit A n=3 Tax=Archaeoglobus fulgidus TaxID=2234 RepID=GATA_ARCFU|nr:Asp-tRNA(Asn)/Glu-tRNA(Gln) amidotransferase subunit GatA [Archaeoglobus fulgidus]O27955.1 RecName: Full=Glutamyl-tRNA(Gln) amidotransferase subunit A; Short=Glu-ADT subunit A [Archaeoglobus fulgidus DSM 4304]AAB88921.1 Glu-tRNA amidotransferase, subunit A (gatA-2) [Archaeoglobus fulgidus DSM 4304]AIG99339.1 aspartyl/glutamyl-tRNA(Asn/Gln) amidotransferase, A subunit [Archaeoglobus fulgidus DSM 8774]KUJ94712.1 MAG: Glutamyl-tRNA(Gln) amidotransferase subunit A [Archaeoglobus fulgidus]KUK069
MRIAEWKEKVESQGCYDAVSEMLERIEKSRLNAYITVCKDEALKMAEKYDRGELKGRLAGIPVAVKDNISTKGILTTCASKMLSNYRPVFDAHVVEKLKQEGAIIIGKANMDEFAMGTTTETSYFGVVRNPHDEARVAGGSSGGSGAVIAADEAVLSLGSDTGGSIRCPASFCGVYGLKPTYGLVSRYGLIPYANSLEQIGPMADSIEDLALLLEVIAGKDTRDSTNAGREFRFEPEDRKLRVGIIAEMGGNDDVMKRFNEAVEVIREKHEVGEVSMPSFKYALAAYYIIAMSEASSNLARYDGVRYGFALEKLDSWRRYFSKVRAEGFGDEVKRRIMLGSYALSAGYYGKYYLKAQKVRTLVIRDFKKAFEEYDVLISPTMPALPFKIGELADPLTMYKADVNTVPVNLAGLPALSVPVGMVKGLPVGLQVIGNYFSENTLLNFGKWVGERFGEGD